MKKILVLCSFLISFGLTQLYSQQDINGWYWLNGQPTGNNLNWVYITETGSHYAIGAKGLFAKSTNGGMQWTLKSSIGLPDAALSYRDLKTGFFFDANTGFAAGSAIINNVQGVVSKTVDGGATWTNYQYNDTSGSVNGMYFINSTTGFICGGTRVRVHKTVDGGMTWTEISNGLSGTNTYNAVFALDENNIYLAYSTRRLYYTSNGGTNWSLISLPGTSGGTSITDVFFKDANTGYACGSPNYFAYTTNAGVNWTQNNPSIPSTLGQRDLNYYNSILYMVGGSRAYLFKSTNDGATWDSIKFYDSSNVNQPIGPTFNNVSVRGNDMIIVGSAGHVTSSSDGGSSWTNRNYSVNSGSNYYNSINMKSPDDIWLSSTGGVGSLLHTTNAGANWTQIPSAHNVAIFQLDFTENDTVYSCAGNVAGSIGQIAKSVNGGLNWSLLSNPAANHTYMTLDFLNGSTGYVGGGGSGLPSNIYKTTDGGITWITQQTGVSGSVYSVKMIDLNLGYALTTTLNKTTNGGVNWTSISIPSGSWLNMYVINNDVIFINGATASFNGNPLIYKTTDGGGNWINVTGDLPDSVTVNRTRWLNLNDGIAGFSNGLVAKTSNGGTNWVISNFGVSNISDVAFSNKNLWYAVSNTGTNFPIARNTDNITSISVNLYIGIEGFWNGTTQVSDTVTAELRSSTPPYNTIDVASTMLTSGTGYGSFEFLTAPAGDYYIVVKHRNSLETWSTLSLSMISGGNYNYNFTSSSSQAYGNNTVLKSGRYCNYSGDVNQDGTIDALDFAYVDNDAAAGLTGYQVTDLDGNNIVDGSDVTIADNNSSMYISVMTPP